MWGASVNFIFIHVTHPKHVQNMYSKRIKKSIFGVHVLYTFWTRNTHKKWTLRLLLALEKHVKNTFWENGRSGRNVISGSKPVKCMVRNSNSKEGKRSTTHFQKEMPSKIWILWRSEMSIGTILGSEIEKFSVGNSNSKEGKRRTLLLGSGGQYFSTSPTKAHTQAFRREGKKSRQKVFLSFSFSVSV